MVEQAAVKMWIEPSMAAMAERHEVGHLGRSSSRGGAYVMELPARYRRRHPACVRKPGNAFLSRQSTAMQTFGCGARLSALASTRPVSTQPLRPEIERWLPLSCHLNTPRADAGMAEARGDLFARERGGRVQSRPLSVHAACANGSTCSSSSGLVTGACVATILA